MVLRKLRLRLLVLVDLASAYAAEFVPNAIDGFNGDPLDGIEKSFSLSPKDVFYTPTNASLSTELFQEERSINNMPFSDVSWVSSHNSHANRFASAENVIRQLATNQEHSVYEQLSRGVRGLMLDIEYRNGSLQCVHGFVEFSLLRDLIQREIIPFLNEDEQCVITIDFETRGDAELIRRALRDLLEQIPDLERRIFRVNDKHWENHTEWPTIAQMREADQRVLILVDNSVVASNDMGLHYRYNVTMENHWQGSLDSCSPRNGIANSHVPWTMPYIAGFDKTWTRLFTLNHFCCSTGIESLRRVNPSRIGGGDNGWGTLFPRMMQCIAESRLGRKPNFIAVDWVNIGDVHEIAYYMNFGGRLGVGQRCESGLDCATGSCSAEKVCHCQPACSESTWNATFGENPRLPFNTAAIIRHAEHLLLVPLLLLLSVFL